MIRKAAETAVAGMSQKPLPFSTYPPSAGRSPANSAPGSANQLSEPSQDRKIQAEIEAERLWWSEVSERQVQELESSFEEEFKKTTEKLRSDIARCQDRLELLVESERKQRHAEINEIKREVSANIRSAAERPTIVAETPPEFHSLRKDLDDCRTVLSARFASLQAEYEQSKAQWSSADARVGDLRKDFHLYQESQQINVSQIQDLRRDLTSLGERSQLMAQSNEEMHQLHQVILQHTNNREEDVAAATSAIEQKLRQELESTRRALEASSTKMRSDILETIANNCRQLQQSLADEREKRALEANVLRTKLDSTSGRLADSEVLVKDLQRNSLETLATPIVAEDDALRPLVDSLRNDLAKLELDVVNDRAAQLGSHDRLRSQMAEGLADERKTCIMDLEELRKHMEDTIKRLRLGDSSEVGGAKGRSSSVDSGNGVLIDATSIQDLHDLRSDLSTLKANLHVVDSECRRAVAASTRVESEILDLEGQVRKSAAVVPRVESLEETCRKYATVARKVEALESGTRQAGREPEIRQLESEMRRALHDVVPLASRIEAIEATVNRANANPRIEGTIDEIQSIRASMALATDVSSLQGDLKEVAAGLVNLRKTVMPSLSAVVPASAPQQATNARGRSSSVQRGAVKVMAYETRSPPAVEQKQLPLPSLSDDLKNSIENLVYKVNKTLTKPGDVVVASDMRVDHANPNDEILQKAVQELRERNLHLREGNAEIVEELLEHDGLLTPNSLPDGPPLFGRSEASSVNPTPSQQQQPTAQFNPLGVGIRTMTQAQHGLQQRPSRGVAPSMATALRSGSPPVQGLPLTYPSSGRPSTGYAGRR